MDKDVIDITDNTDFDGYVIVDWAGIYNRTTCPNTAVSMALERRRAEGEKGIIDIVKVYRIGTMGKYAKVPGERFAEEYNWKRALRELMR
jgi:hypothetical protein